MDNFVSFAPQQAVLVYGFKPFCGGTLITESSVTQSQHRLIDIQILH
jgi:hypothetical protein